MENHSLSSGASSGQPSPSVVTSSDPPLSGFDDVSLPAAPPSSSGDTDGTGAHITSRHDQKSALPLPLPLHTALPRRRTSRKQWAVTVGAVVLLFAFIGAGTVVGWIISGIRGSIDNAVQKEMDRYAAFIRPVVLFDPPVFDDIAHAQNSELLKAAYWAAQEEWKNNEQGLSITTMEDGSLRFILPQSELARMSIRLFGAEPSYESFSISGVAFEYDATNQCFFVPVTSIAGQYVPRVTKIRRDGNTTILTVAYISITAIGDDPNPDKIMLYRLMGNKGEEIIHAIQNVK